MKRTCWNCKHFILIGDGLCTKTSHSKDTGGDDSCSDFIIADELKNGGKFVMKENGNREFED